MIPDWLDLDRLKRTVPMPGWERYAACRGKPREWWFPERGAGHIEAKRICKTCPARYACLKETLRVEDVTTSRRAGWWAGTSANQRDAIAAALQKKRAAA